MYPDGPEPKQYYDWQLNLDFLNDKPQTKKDHTDPFVSISTLPIAFHRIFTE
jgi:hypothetical protein